MPIRASYQSTILPATLYEVRASGLGSETIAPSIEVIGGTANIYGSIQQPVSAPTNMMQAGTAFSGINTFATMPNFLYVTQASGTITITLNGITAKTV